ncbi:RING-H2 finger protein ATL29 [Abeliophyllum distichum]|uniref:RING-type E3 ubiquitin transferase n=1 Tax=Abeliophyllum distichum TaxID=126358 RepID=A0ABD1UJN6_9LAMI
MSIGSVKPITSEAKYAYQPITVILIVIILIFFFLGFFSLYFSRCFIQNVLQPWHLRHSPTGTPVGGPTASVTANNGLDTLIIQSFPTFKYSTVKDYRREKYGLECAICLVEFKDEDLLRLLTSCNCHVFHQECIDLWFESHKTCPVCRRSLDSPVDSPVKPPVSIDGNAINETTENEAAEAALADTFTITIRDDNIEDAKRVSFKVEEEEEDNKAEIFCRSHSTGHSIVKIEDRFSLRLPENVKTEIMRGHNWSRSCTTFGDYRGKSVTGNRSLGEASGGDSIKT